MAAPLRLLLMADDPRRSSLVERELRRAFESVRLTSVTDLAALDRNLQEPAFDLGLLDVPLAWTDGHAVIRRLSAHHPDWAVVPLVASADEPAAQRALAVGDIDREGRIECANTHGAAVVGWTPEALRSLNQAALFPSDVAQHAERAAEVFRTGTPIETDSHDKLGGRAVWLHTSLVPLRDEAGEGVNGFGRNALCGRSISSRSSASPAWTDTNRTLLSGRVAASAGAARAPDAGPVIAENPSCISRRRGENLSTCRLNWRVPQQITRVRGRFRGASRHGGCSSTRRERGMELLRTLGTVMSPPDAIVARLAAVLELPASPTSSEHTFLFGSQLPPFASVYLSTSGERGGDACDRIAGYWRAVGLTPPAEPDRLAHMLGFYADLLDQEEHEADQARRHAVTRIRKAFLAEQLLTWLPAFLTKVDLIAPRPYRRWGQLVEQVIGREAWRSAPLATVPPLQERDRARVDPRPGDVESLVTYLAAPVRCGLILAPVDLERVAAELQVATPADHVGQALRALFAARPNDLLAWLTSEARRWEARHERNRDLLPALSDHWTRRARTTRVLLINWSRGADAATAVGEPAEPAHAGAGPAGTPRDSSNRPRTPR